MTQDVDPEDDLPVGEAGEWAAEKYRMLADYVVATRFVRGKLKKGEPRPAYIDLFSGPGKARMENTGEIVDGSPLVAWGAARDRENPFAAMFVSDAHPDYPAAASKRLQKRGAHVLQRCSDAMGAAKWAADQLDPHSYHLAFVDPYNLADLPWDVFPLMTWHQHIDFIVHFSQGDLTRNLDSYTAKEQSILDGFAPGWRDHVGAMRDPVQTRGLFFEHWLNLFLREGYKLAESVPFKNSKNVTLYRLVLLSRNPLAKKIWKSVAKKPQGAWDF